MKLRIISRSLQIYPAQSFDQIELNTVARFHYTSLHLSLRQVSQNSGILSGIARSSIKSVKNYAGQEFEAGQSCSYPGRQLTRGDLTSLE